VDDDEIRDAPPVVIGAVTAGVAPLPFLAVYAVLFISRGTVRPVIPPDIGTSKGDELAAGLIALALLIIGALAVYWFLDGRRRWLFLLAQAATLAISIDFLIDPTSGSPAVPILLAATSVLALVLAVLPASWEHMRRDAPPWLRRHGAGRQADPAESAVPARSRDSQR
jgi:hypothetical protein